MTRPFKPGRGYAQEDWDAVDSPEATDDELATARPFPEAFPQLTASIRKRGPAKTKEAVSIRLDFDVVKVLRDSGSGWQGRANDMLRKALGL